MRGVSAFHGASLKGRPPERVLALPPLPVPERAIGRIADGNEISCWLRLVLVSTFLGRRSVTRRRDAYNFLRSSPQRERCVESIRSELFPVLETLRETVRRGESRELSRSFNSGI